MQTMHRYQVSALLTFLRERKCARTEGKKMEVMSVLAFLRIVEIMCKMHDIYNSINGYRCRVAQQRTLT